MDPSGTNVLGGNHHHCLCARRYRDSFRARRPSASQLLTVMLIGFGLLVWLPIVISYPHKLFNWTESAETLAIAGVAWIVTDFLTRSLAFHAV
jgi:hypothetical protein